MENVQENNQLQVVTNDMQMMPISQVQAWYGDFVKFSQSILKTGLDYGTIPGTPKPTLYKAGAEKLRFVYGLGVEFETIDKTVDLNMPFIDYTYRCTVRAKSNQILSQCEGNCNSLESKFGYVWKSSDELPIETDLSKLPSRVSGKKLFEFDFAIEKSETTGQYGKPEAYWNKWKDAIKKGIAKKVSKKSKAGKDLTGYELDETVIVYRILNPDVIGVKNTIMKMAQKRAFVGAILLATGASEFFTQDIEDMEINGAIYSEEHIPDAEIITDPVKPVAKEKFIIPGHWYAKLEQCKTKSDLLALYNSHKETVDAHYEIKELFKQTQENLKEKEVENV